MLNEHFHCKSDEPAATPASVGDTPPWAAPTEPVVPAVVEPSPVESSVEDDIDELLADL